MQVIIQAQSGKQPNSEFWAKLLNHVCYMRRFHPHGKAISLADELALKVAEAFHEWRVKVAVKGRATFEDFAQGPFKVRLAVGVEGADQLGGVRGGYAILNGELLAFSNLDRGRGAWLFSNAMDDGAIFFDAFENSPIVKHAKFYGYVEYARVPNYLGEQHPDVVYMCKLEHFQQCRRQWENSYKSTPCLEELERQELLFCADKLRRTTSNSKAHAASYGGTVTGRTAGKPQPQERGGDVKLTERECQVLELIADGMSYGKIARTLGVTRHAVYLRACSVRAKLNLRPGELPAWVSRTGFVKRRKAAQEARFSIAELGISL